MTIRSLLYYTAKTKRDQEQEIQVGVTLAQCNRETKNCDGFGECVKTELVIKTGEFICSCMDGYFNKISTFKVPFGVVLVTTSRL